jgi:hypothetical protein
MDAYFRRVDESRFQPTVHAGGAWASDELHLSPLAGLIVHAIDGYRAGRPDAGLLLSRISYDILGRLANDVCEIRVETIRPGRTIELLEATLSIGGRAVIRARAWLLSAFDTSEVAGGSAAPLPDPKALATWPMEKIWPGGYIASLDVRPVVPIEPGRAIAWLSTANMLVDGEEAGPLASYVMLVDTANGIAARESPTSWLFPNVDLTIHLHRQPEGRWVGLDSTAVFGSTGQGITSSVLHDVTGAVGRAQQMLTVRPPLA